MNKNELIKLAVRRGLFTANGSGRLVVYATESGQFFWHEVQGSVALTKEEVLGGRQVTVSEISEDNTGTKTRKRITKNGITET